MKNFIRMVLLITLYLILCYLFLLNHIFDINPDGISYIEIAKLYRQGYIKEAVNAYWSPLYSIVLLPLSSLFDWISASRVLILILNILWLIGSYFLAYVILKSKTNAFIIVIFCFLFPFFQETWKLISPDYLLNVYTNFLLLTFFWIIRRKDINEKKWILFGLLIAIGYLIKSFFLTFAIIFFPLSLIILLGINFLRPLIFLSLGFSFFVLIWSIMIFWKYDKFSLGTNSFVVYKNSVLQNKFEFLYKPVNYPIRGTSYWIDPSDFTFPSIDINKQIAATSRNVIEALQFLLRKFNIGLIILLFGFYKLKKNKKLYLLLIFSVLWIAIYSLILIEQRYLWPIITPLLILIISNLKSSQRWLLIGYFIIALILFVKTYMLHYPPDPNSLLHKQISKDIKTPCVILSDRWERGLYISFFSGCKYYGVSETSFKTYDIDKTLRLEIKLGKVTNFIAFDGKRYIKTTNLLPEHRWFFNNQDVILYKTNVNEY